MGGSSRAHISTRQTLLFCRAGDYLPMWFRPDLSKVIVTDRQYDDGDWLMVSEAGQKMDSAILSWILIWAANNKKNVRYQVDGGWNWIRNSER